MNKLSDVAKAAVRTANIHSPAILIGVGVAGLVTTTVFAARAGYKSAHKLESEPADLTVMERAKIVWPLYIPAAAMGAVTIAAMITSQHISARRSAALMSLYTVTNQAFGEYKQKIVETLGEKKELAVRDELAQDRMRRADTPDKTIFLAGSGDLLCYDEHSGRFFESDFESIRSAENTLNAEIIRQNYASLNDWYRLIGLAPLPTGEELGWNTDKLLDIQYTTMMGDNNRPALSIGFYVQPMEKHYSPWI